MQELGTRDIAEVIETASYEGENWKLLQGDCIERLKEIPERET